MAYMSSLNTGGGVLPITTTLYGVCSTAASTAAKVVTLSNVDSLADGFRIAILFTNGNSATSSVTLNINNIGAISISSIYTFGSNTLLDLIYISNTFYILNNNIKDYLPLTGGTLSGNLNIENSNGNSEITLGKTGNTGIAKFVDATTGYYSQIRSSNGITSNLDILLPKAIGTIATEESIGIAYLKLSAWDSQTITTTSNRTDALIVKSGATAGNRCMIMFQNTIGTNLGYLGANSSSKPIYVTPDNEEKQIMTYVYHENISFNVGGSKDITIPSDKASYLVTWAPGYIEATHGAWIVLVGRSNNIASVDITILSALNCSLTYSAAYTLHFSYGYSGGGDYGILSCIQL